MKKNPSDLVLPSLIVLVGLVGAAAVVYGIVVAASGHGAEDRVLSAFAGAGLVVLACCLWVSYALTGGEPSWGWARRSCDRIRAWQRREQVTLRRDIMRHLASLSPEERAKEVERLTDGSSIVSMDIPDKESFLHPRNWPQGRINAPDGTSD